MMIYLCEKCFNHCFPDGHEELTVGGLGGKRCMRCGAWCVTRNDYHVLSGNTKLTVDELNRYCHKPTKQECMNLSLPNITELRENEIFVFGSNLSGYHGAGAAKTAMKWGAIFGQPFGLQGQTYAIPTVGVRLQRILRPDEIRVYVDDFIKFAKEHPELTFLVTEIGCGLAGHEPKDIAPLFEGAKELDNVYLPQRFLEILFPPEHDKWQSTNDSSSSTQTIGKP